MREEVPYPILEKNCIYWGIDYLTYDPDIIASRPMLRIYYGNGNVREDFTKKETVRLRVLDDFLLGLLSKKKYSKKYRTDPLFLDKKAKIVIRYLYNKKLSHGWQIKSGDSSLLEYENIVLYKWFLVSSLYKNKYHNIAYCRTKTREEAEAFVKWRYNLKNSKVRIKLKPFPSEDIDSFDESLTEKYRHLWSKLL